MQHKPELTSLGVVLKPRAVVRGVVEHDVDHAQHAVVLLDLAECLLHLLLLDVLREALLLVQVVRERELVEDRVRAIALAALLERGEVDHVVPATAHALKVRGPLLEVAHPLGDDALDDEAVERERHRLGLHDAASCGREHLERRRQNRRAQRDRQDRRDAEVPRAASDARLARLDLGRVFDVVRERASLRDL